MASKSNKRTTRFAFVINGKIDRVELTRMIIKFNDEQEKLEQHKKAANPSTRFCPLAIGRLHYLEVEANDNTQFLAYTKSRQQFEFTKWYDFLHNVFAITETMKDQDKFEQIKDFSLRLKRVKCIDFEGGVGCKRGGGDESDDAFTPLKKIVLGESLPAVRVGDTMMKQTTLMAVPDSNGAKQCDPSDGVDAQLTEAETVARFFQAPDERYIKSSLLAYLSGAGRIPAFKTPPAIAAATPGDNKHLNYKEARKSLNTTPSAMKLIHIMFPPFFKKSTGREFLLGKLSAEHVDCLLGLERLLSPGSWQGIYTLYMTVDSQELNYDVPSPGLDGGVVKKACFTELWRRALKLEDALAKFAVYFSDIIGKTPLAALNVVSRQTIGNVVAFLSAGPGLYVEEGCFWKKRLPDFLQKLTGCAADPAVLEILEWLGANRGGAFTALYPKAHELDALIPVMAYVFNIRDSLGNLKDLKTAMRVVEGVKEEVKSRVQLYAACTLPLMLYGAKTTW